MGNFYPSAQVSGASFTAEERMFPNDNIKRFKKKIFIMSLNHISVANFLENKDIRVLSLCDSEIRRYIVSKKLITISLKPELSYRFLTDRVFCQRVKSIGEIDCLNLENATAVNKRALERAQVHTISIFKVRGVETFPLSHIHNVYIHQCDISNLSALAGIHTVAITFCDYVEDVSPLRDSHTVTISHCREVYDLSELGQVQDLTLDGFKNPFPVITSSLEQVHTISLSMSWSRAIQDITAFHKVRNLKIWDSCVEDISTLTSIQTLHISRCDNITNLESLKNAQKLAFFDCRGISDVCCLSNVHTLELGCLPQIVDISSLSRVHTLQLDRMDVTDVRSLSSVNTLTLENCTQISDLSPLSTVKTLIMSDMSTLQDVSLLATVQKLSLINCKNVVDVTPLKNIHTLTLKGMEQVVDVSALGNIRVLTLEGMAISDVTSLGSVYRLALINCQGVTDVSPLADVPFLSLESSMVYRNGIEVGKWNLEMIAGLCKLRKVHSLKFKAKYEASRYVIRSSGI